jgi:adenylosuccinate synthase
MPVTVVVGTQWGDEGKAKVIDLLAGSHSHVVRYQGGHNAGHTVVVGNQRYALQLVPSGVLYETVVPVIGNGVVVDLPTLFAEIDTLESRGVSCKRLRVSTLAHLIFPWHQRHDAMSEALRGDAKLGTTLKGIGPAYADKVKRIGVRAGEVRDRERFRVAVKERATQENALFASLGEPLMDVDAVVAQYDEYAQRLLAYLDDTVNMLHGALERGANILLEGAQATFLDIDHGTYPFVTSSNPTAGGACAGSGIGPRDISRVVGIAKAYTTRVGAGPFPTEVHGELGDRIVDIGHEFGTVTGRRRRPGWLDLVMLRHAVRVNSLTDIALTKLDVLDDFDTIRVCVGYQLEGRELQGFPDDAETLARVECVYVDIPGWKQSLRACRREADLPREVLLLLSLVEQHTKVPVSVVGVGPERDDVVLRGASS